MVDSYTFEGTLIWRSRRGAAPQPRASPPSGSSRDDPSSCASLHRHWGEFTRRALATKFCVVPVTERLHGQCVAETVNSRPKLHRMSTDKDDVTGEHSGRERGRLRGHCQAHRERGDQPRSRQGMDRTHGNIGRDGIRPQP